MIHERNPAHTQKMSCQSQKETLTKWNKANLENLQDDEEKWAIWNEQNECLNSDFASLASDVVLSSSLNTDWLRAGPLMSGVFSSQGRSCSCESWSPSKPRACFQNNRGERLIGRAARSARKVRFKQVKDALPRGVYVDEGILKLIPRKLGEMCEQSRWNPCQTTVGNQASCRRSLQLQDRVREWELKKCPIFQQLAANLCVHICWNAEFRIARFKSLI